MNFGKWVGVACIALLAGPADLRADNHDTLGALFALSTPHYTGGLTREDRKVANAIHASMAARYTATCRPVDPSSGELIGYSDDRADKPVPPLGQTDPDLKALTEALDNPKQEIRDVAAYTIGLLGPSANVASPTLSAKWFGHGHEWSGWFGFALERVSCQKLSAADFRKTIPAELLPPEKPWPDFLAAAAIVLAKLYLDPNVEYPPDMMGYAYGNYALSDRAKAAVPLLAQILEDDSLSYQKKLEAAEALRHVKTDDIRPAERTLEKAVQSNDWELRQNAALALIGLHDEAAIPVIIEGIGSEYGDWSDQLCLFGHAALSAEDRLLRVVAQSQSLSDIRQAVHALGCVGSAKAIPVLAPMLSKPDWLLNMTAAKAIGEIGTRDPAVRAYLQKLATSHWSSKVRNAAHDALFPPVRADEKPKATSDIVTVTIGGDPGPFDHGLPWCDEHGRYSIDGHTWFMVKWIEPYLQPVPRGFRPQRPLLQGVGTQVFVRVPDGWLLGSKGFEGEGVFVHVGDDGSIQNLEGEYAIKNIVKLGGRYFAFSVDVPGWLYQIGRLPDGTWRADRVVALPGVANSYAVSPDGHLLLSDGPNDYAIVDGQITPLKCEKRYPGSYFDKYPEDDFVLKNY